MIRIGRELLIALILNALTALGLAALAYVKNGEVIHFLGGVTQADLSLLKSQNDATSTRIDQLKDYVTRKEPTFASGPQRQSLPAGTVIALDGDRCPEGWENFLPASGRFLVGAGDHTNRQLSVYTLRQTGGLESVTLTVNQMPPHRHSYSVSGRKAEGESVDNWTKDLKIGSTIKETSTTGGGMPHENRPPFIALTFCRLTTK